MENISPLVFLVAFGLIAALAGLIVYGIVLERRRARAIATVAARLGLTFSPDRDPALARACEHLQGLHEGNDRYASHVLTGAYAQRQVTTFDFHYETTSRGSDGKSRTDHHYRHVVLLHLEKSFPGLTLAPEGLFSKMAQALGYDDIDFESHEFSRRFCVRSPDKRFAYAFCNARMIDHLLAEPAPNLEIAGARLAFVHHGTMDPRKIEPRLAQAAAIRELMPAYLFAA